ncbi:uncharacterized protein LOC129258259 [Lytechinus pictus]|uniref:uncharacterized protein LOC129258259 n=1 Tax=Lytechinus pictus TaxID=7653 RepID=UPI0030B9B5BC
MTKESRGTSSPMKGGVDPDTLKGKIPDSKRVFPYDPSSHTTSKYALEPDTRPEGYNQNSAESSFNMARRKLHTLLLGLLLGSILLGVSLTCGLVFGKANERPLMNSTNASQTNSGNSTVYS